MRGGLSALLVVLCAIGSACGGGKDEASETTTTTVSVAQVASIVARHRQPILDAFDAEDRCRSIECVFASAIYNRFVKMDELQAQLAVELQGVSAPSEVASLVSQTIAVATKAQDGRKAFEACMDVQRAKGTNDSTPCGPQLSEWERSWRAMKPQLAAWDPYL